MAHRKGFPKPSASPRTIRRWKIKCKISKDPVKLAKVAAWEAVNGTVQL